MGALFMCLSALANQFLKKNKHLLLYTPCNSQGAAMHILHGLGAGTDAPAEVLEPGWGLPRAHDTGRAVRPAAVPVGM